MRFRLRHIPDCDRCNLDDFEMVMNGVCNGCYKKAFQKDLFEAAILLFLIDILIAAIDWWWIA